MSDVIEILLWVGAAAWILFFFQGLVNGLLVRHLGRIDAPTPHHWPSVSFVVPARDEQRGIGRAVSSFCQQDYPDFEVIVVNDRSTDDTGRILAELQEKFTNLNVVDGAEPPEGWLGKPNALCQGESLANGEWILMADADSVLDPQVLRRAVAYGIQEGVGMVTVRPRLVSQGVLEAVLMSGLNFAFFVTLPIFLVRHSKIAIFATGSPVFNLIRRDALRACGGFASLKRAVVDDVEIGFRVKRAGFGIAVAFSGKLINHRMYDGARATVRGFLKTTFPVIKRVPWLLLLYYLGGSILSFLPYYGFVNGLVHGEISVPATISLILMHTVFAGIAWHYQEPWYIIFLNPLREVGWLWIYTRSFIVYMRKGLVWRGREYGRVD